MYRNEETLEPVEYYLKAPSLKKAVVLVLDPMLATGGTVIKVIKRLKERGASKIIFLCIVASPEGIKRFQQEHPDIEIICASVDKKLDKKGYIIPGLGDCGDWLYGTGDAPGWHMSPEQ